MNKLVKVMAFAIALPLTVSVAQAKSNEHQRSGGFYQLVKQLELSDEQKMQIKDIIKQAKSEHPTQDHKADKKEHKEKSLALLTAESFDEAKAITLIESRQEKMKQMQLARLKLQHQVFQVLTPQQQGKYQELMTRKRGHQSQ